MRRHIANLALFLDRLDQRSIRLGFIVLTAILFVLGSGAPVDADGSG